MKNCKRSDAELVALYQQGKEEAFETLLNRHKSKVYTAIYLIVKDKYKAEDLLQDTFIKVINTIKAGRYKEEGKFSPWVCRIAHNFAIDSFRRNRRYPTMMMDDSSRVFNTMQFSEESTESLQITKETHDHLRDCIQDLPAEQKEVLIMRHYMDMSFQEIAEKTDVSINTALGRMRYALINLRKKIIKPQLAHDKNTYPVRFHPINLPGDF